MNLIHMSWSTLPSQNPPAAPPQPNPLLTAVRWFAGALLLSAVVAAPPSDAGTPPMQLAPFSAAPGQMGMTWALLGTNSPSGTVKVGCGGVCNAYNGDTDCAKALPLLCIRKSGTGFPLPKPQSVDNSNQYYLWSGGVIGTTQAVVPPATLAQANALCAAEFGTGWRVAEFHDGWGWSFQAFGGVAADAKKFWVHINDQPGAVCWQ